MRDAIFDSGHGQGSTRAQSQALAGTTWVSQSHGVRSHAVGEDAAFADPVCGIYTLDQTGLRGLSGTYTGDIASCWQR